MGPFETSASAVLALVEETRARIVRDLGELVRLPAASEAAWEARRDGLAAAMEWIRAARGVLDGLRPGPPPPADPIIAATIADLVDLGLNPAVPAAALERLLALAPDLPAVVRLAELA
jgi:hypothetical protein